MFQTVGACYIFLWEVLFVHVFRPHSCPRATRARARSARASGGGRLRGGLWLQRGGGLPAVGAPGSHGDDEARRPGGFKS